MLLESQARAEGTPSRPVRALGFGADGTFWSLAQVVPTTDPVPRVRVSLVADEIPVRVPSFLLILALTLTNRLVTCRTSTTCPR